jgi:hypothetical protein
MKTPYDSDASTPIEKLRFKMDLLKSAVNRYDKYNEDRFDQQQMLRFLDSLMRNGNKFDRALAQKIFTLSDLDDDGKLTTQEFVKTYLMIEEEIKTNSKNYQTNYLMEKDNCDKLYKLMLENKNENLNSEGLCPDAKATIEISDIEFLNKMKLRLNNISIKMTLHDVSNQTRTIKIKDTDNKLILNETFSL